MIEDIKLTNWYYISALVCYTDSEGKTAQIPWSGVIPVDADKITMPMLDQISGFVMGKFAQENDIKKADQFHAITLLGISFLGKMSVAEFQDKEHAADTVQ